MMICGTLEKERKDKFLNPLREGRRARAERWKNPFKSGPHDIYKPGVKKKLEFIPLCWRKGGA